MPPPISIKKLEEEGVWETRKVILGWLFDGIHKTIQLPTEKCKNLLDTLRSTRHKKKVLFNAMEKVRGKLQFTTVALPVGRPLLGRLDALLTAERRKKPASLSTKSFSINVHGTEIAEVLRHWAALIRLMKSRPSHVSELIQQPTASFQGFVDASKFGVGGVWFSGSDQLLPIVWFIEWPESIRALIITDDNPNGTLTIADLELAGIVLHFLALEQTVINLQHKSVAIWCDNLPAVAWCYRARTSTSTIAAHLLMIFAFRLHHTKSSMPTVDHISGVFNILADAASCTHPTNPSEFLSWFTSLFPPPQDCCWTLFRFSDNLISKLCSELQTNQFKPE